MTRGCCRLLWVRLAIVVALMLGSFAARAAPPGSASEPAAATASAPSSAGHAPVSPPSYGTPTEARRREFVVVAAVALAALGVAALVLLLRRPARTPARPAPSPAPASATARAGKVCPRCGARYGSEHRRCPRDDSELSAVN